MKRNVIETVLGAIVIAVAVIFLTFSYSSANVGSGDGYEIKASFSSIGGLNIGDKVVISGVKVGTVTGVLLDPRVFNAIVSMEVDKDIKLPEDTAAFISSESLLGGLYLQLEPGGSEDIMEEGFMITFTQQPQNLEQLLGKFLFSIEGSEDQK